MVFPAVWPAIIEPIADCPHQTEGIFAERVFEKTGMDTS
jgi:hypothetical protein